MATAYTQEHGEDNFVLELNRLKEIDYKSKTEPMISVCDRGTGDEQLCNPLGVAVDRNTGNIYVADLSNHYVKVFDRTGRYLFKFGDDEGEETMISPKCLHIFGNRLLISQGNDCIMLHQLDGKIISRIGSEGSEELEFSNPWGLSTDDSNGDIYVCDCRNNRIQILSENLKFKSQFGKDVLNYPKDVKLYKDNIFILDESARCLHIYNRDLVLHKIVITRGVGKQVAFPRFFIIDKIGNILISDRASDSIHIFNSEYKLVHKISVSSHPMGITVDEEDRIIVACQGEKNCLQIL